MFVSWILQNTSTVCFVKAYCLHLVGLFSGLIALWYLPELQGTLLLELSNYT
jgi:membrane associated rhomboid family serine protease